MKHMYSKLTALGISLLLIIQMFCISPMSVFAQETASINDTNSVELQNEGTASDFTHINNIAILVRFSDSQEYVTPERMATANKIFNGTAAETDGKSLKSYIDYYSHGNLTVDSTFFPYSTNEQGEKIYFSYQDSHPINYYTTYNEKTNPIGYRPDEQSSRLEILLNNAINFVKSPLEVAFTQNELDCNNDNLIDNITFICDTSTSRPIVFRDLLWSHKYTISTSLYNGISANYNLLQTSGYGNYNGAGIVVDGTPEYGTTIHEFLHSLGAPDLYSQSTPRNLPVGDWDIMSSCSEDSPLNEYYRRNVFGWNNPISVITSSQTISLKLENFITANESAQSSVILRSPYSQTEFFVVEYRRKGDSNSPSVNSEGLLVYRISTEINDNSSSPYHLYVFRPNATSINADYSLSDVNNALLHPWKSNWYGIGKPLYTENPNFDPNTLFYNNGENSGIIINNINLNSSNNIISFDVTIPQLCQPVGGSGNLFDPYIITNPNQLDFIYCNPDKFYKLGNDIDFSLSNVLFRSIKNFSGSLDGNGKNLINFARSNIGTSDTPALFESTTESATIKNLTFMNPQITSSNINGASVLAQTLNGRIENVNIIGGNIQCTYLNFPTYAASLAVISNADLLGCSSSANVINTSFYGGGLIGFGTGYISSCIFTGTVNASIGGGIAGVLGSVTISNSYSTGSISGEFVGGLTGQYNGNSNLINTFSNSVINGTSATGGIAGIYFVTPITGPSTIQNVYWNTTLSNTTDAIGTINNQTGNEEISLPSGMVGVGIPASLSFNSSASQQLTLTTNPADASVTGTWGTTPFYSNVSVSSTGLVSPQYNGESPVTYTIPVGDNQMVLSANASVSNMQDPPKTLITKVDSTYAMLNGMVGRTTMNNGVYTTVKLVNNITMMPVRFLAETMGLTVSWNEAEQSTVITNPATGEYLMLQIGSTAISKYSQDGTLIASATMPAATTTIESSTYAPARIVAESFGFQVEYVEYADSEIFVITSNRTPAWTAEEIAAMCADASGKI